MAKQTSNPDALKRERTEDGNYRHRLRKRGWTLPLIATEKDIADWWKARGY